MKLTIQLQLFPDPQQTRRLRETMERFNLAASWLAGEAFALKMANKIELQKRGYYRELRSRFGLSAQMAVRCIAQVCEAYKRDKSKQPKFRKHASVPYDQRLMSFKGLDRVSLLTLEGRVIVPLLVGKYQRERFCLGTRQSDLVLRKDGKWFLLATVDAPDGAPIPTTDFFGVDLGIANIAADSDGGLHSGESVEKVRQRHHLRRRSLQKAATKRLEEGKRPKSIRRALRRTKSQEARFRRDTNHCISKKLVALAKDTRRGLALEDLKGIRDRIEPRFRRQQRAKVSGWSFLQLRQFLAYKSRLAGVLLVSVDPRGTSRTCSLCRYCSKRNRKSRSVFLCRCCGHTANADTEAAVNIAARAGVNQLQVSDPHRTSSVA